jgi:hypothetical protein
MFSRCKTAALAVGLMSCLATSAEAQQRSERANLTRPTSGHTYFNRPGATIADHDADVRLCAAHAAGLTRAQDNVVIGGLLPALMAGAQDDSRTQANVENCMVVKGWRVVRLPRNLGATLNRMRREALSEQLATVVGVETPASGEIVRTFTNEGARGDTVWGAMPGYGGSFVLSLDAVDLTNLPELPRAVPAIGAVAGPPVGARILTPAMIADLPAESAIVITRAVGTGQSNGEGFSFLRIPEDGETPFIRTVETDPTHAFMSVLPWTLFKGSARERRETVTAFAVVPGRYRLTAKMNTMDYCHGSPVLEIRAGDVIFAGTFDLSGNVGPDLSLEPAREFLAADPTRLARLQPAEWHNGSTATCGYVYNYAIEFPGMPFVEGYEGGSARQP